MSARPVQWFQGYLPLRSVEDGIGDPCLTTTFAILGPGFRQKQLAIDQGLVPTAGHSQMHRDETVVDFARVAAPLPLDARSLGSLFRRAGFVDDANSAKIVHRLVAKPFGNVLL